ncbi:MAG: Clp1/GlmU family protein [bacterium]|nr:Clp1/GlmU family protein [bacterium]
MEKFEILKKEEFEIFLKNGIKKILFIGGSDTGKTTLIKDIANFLFENNKDVFIFDCDIGQSHIGPPTTIGYAKLKEKIGDDFYLKPEKFYFTGTVSPSFSIINFLTGVIKINKYLEGKRGKILIDTTGYIKDKTAISLKINKIEIIQPDLVILLEKENELEEIVEFLKFTKIIYKRITVKDLPIKNMEERANYRKMRFSQYFENTKEIILELDKISIKIINFKNISKFNEIFNFDLKRVLCSLKNEFFEDISLGIIKQQENRKLIILVPEEIDIKKIKGITISNFLFD